VFDPVALRDALSRVPEAAWSLPSSYRATGAHHGYRRVVLEELEPFRFVLAEFDPIHNAWLSCIDPGGYIVRHRDKGPHHERWQVPIVTAGWMEQDDRRSTAVDGVPFRVEQWKWHAVGNPTRHARIHLVIDRDIIADPTIEPFTREEDL
jgi:hypothetical protein